MRRMGPPSFQRCYATFTGYTRTHEWINILDYNCDKKQKEYIGTCGVTVQGQNLLGDVIHFCPPVVSQNVIQESSEVCTVETVKEVVSINAPVTGTIVEVNHELENDPVNINLDPQGQGWMFRMKFSNSDDFEKLLLTIEEYKKSIC